MNKFDLVLDPAGMPDRINALPELCYPHRLNSTKAIFEAAAAERLGRSAGVLLRRPDVDL